ncbi:MAG: hypothetical protein JNJ58_05950 [Chitinophagaceae bacterium]|nr:hypothetical protein [Chitinophagaceae bacterium]
MGQTTITLSVNTSILKEESRNSGTGQPLYNNWASITQTGDGTSAPPPGGDAKNFISQVYKGDVITWNGVLNPSSVIPDGDPTPVINITQIELSDTIPADTFGAPVPTILPDGRSSISMTALKDFPAGLDAQSYTIHFVISYKARFLDPKIKVVQPPR